MEERKPKKSIQTTNLQSKTRSNLEGEVKCFKCGQVHSYEGLLDGGECSNCQVSLVKELF